MGTALPAILRWLTHPKPLVRLLQEFRQTFVELPGRHMALSGKRDMGKKKLILKVNFMAVRFEQRMAVKGSGNIQC